MIANASHGYRCIWCNLITCVSGLCAIIASRYLHYSLLLLDAILLSTVTMRKIFNLLPYFAIAFCHFNVFQEVRENNTVFRIIRAVKCPCSFLLCRWNVWMLCRWVDREEYIYIHFSRNATSNRIVAVAIHTARTKITSNANTRG